MTDTLDTLPTYEAKPASKYKRCSHCGTYSQVEGKCPFCERGVVR
jgi:primosomal protein N'